MTDYSTKRADRATLLKLIGKIAKKKTIFNPQRAEGTSPLRAGCFFRQGKTVRDSDGFLLFGFIVFC